MVFVILAGIIPAVILLTLGQSWRPVENDPASYSRWAKFLAVSLGSMVGLVLLATALWGESGSIIVLLIMPSICALIAESILYCIAAVRAAISTQNKSSIRWAASHLFIVIVLLSGLVLLGDSYVLIMVLFGGALLAIGHFLWNRMGRWLAFSYPLLVGLLVFTLWGTDSQSQFSFLPAVIAPIVRPLLTLVPALGIVFVFQAIRWALSDESLEQRSAARRLLIAGLLVLPVILLIAWQTATASAWDVATDGLGGIFMIQMAGLVGIAAAMHQSWDITPKRRSFLLGISFVLTLVVSAATTFGTFGFDGAWGNVPHARTERRAEVVNRAILRYHESQGSYPQSLNELTPGYLLYLPVPFIIPQQDWCYEGGADYYRLGYVTRDYFSTPALVKVHASAGQPLVQSWSCDAEAAKYQGYGVQ
jgi:hypothetical protein